MLYDRTTYSFASNGSSPTFGINGPVALTVEWNSGVSAGTVTLEVAPTATPDAWNAKRTITWSTSSPKVDSSIDDIADPVGRITVSGLAGGTVDVTVTRQTKAVY